MPRKRKLITVSFKTEQDLEAARRKAKRHKLGFSEAVQKLFREMPDAPPAA